MIYKATMTLENAKYKGILNISPKISERSINITFVNKQDGNWTMRRQIST